MHLCVEPISARAGLPLFHIADAAADEIARTRARRKGLLGTPYAMEKGFHKDRLREQFGIEAIVPGEADRLEINRIIFAETLK
jgi:aspartate racemase